MWERLRAAVLASTLVVFGVLVGVASAAGQVGVSPSPGYAHTRFSVSSHTQLATGPFAGMRRRDTVSVR